MKNVEYTHKCISRLRMVKVGTKVRKEYKSPIIEPLRLKESEQWRIA